MNFQRAIKKGWGGVRLFVFMVGSIWICASLVNAYDAGNQIVLTPVEMFLSALIAGVLLLFMAWVSKKIRYASKNQDVSILLRFGVSLYVFVGSLAMFYTKPNVSMSVWYGVLSLWLIGIGFIAAGLWGWERKNGERKMQGK